MTDRPSSPESSAGTRMGLALLLGGTAAIAVAYGATVVLRAPPAWAPWLLVFGGASTPLGLFVLGAVTRHALTRGVTVILAALFVVLLTSFGAALWLPGGEGAGSRLVLGLPLRLAIVFYGVGFIPLFALPLTFAVTFGDDEAPGRGQPRASGP